MSKINFSDLSKVMDPMTNQDYIEYIIDTDKPSTPPIAHGISDMWVHKQQMYYAEVNLVREYTTIQQPDTVFHEENYMVVHIDVLTPFLNLSSVLQKAISEVLGPANRLHGNIKVYRKLNKYKPRVGYTLTKSSDMLNLWEKAK